MTRRRGIGELLGGGVHDPQRHRSPPMPRHPGWPLRTPDAAARPGAATAARSARPTAARARSRPRVPRHRADPVEDARDEMPERAGGDPGGDGDVGRAGPAHAVTIGCRHGHRSQDHRHRASPFARARRGRDRRRRSTALAREPGPQARSRDEAARLSPGQDPADDRDPAPGARSGARRGRPRPAHRLVHEGDRRLRHRARRRSEGRHRRSARRGQAADVLVRGRRAPDGASSARTAASRSAVASRPSTTRRSTTRSRTCASARRTCTPSSAPPSSATS